MQEQALILRSGSHQQELDVIAAKLVHDVIGCIEEIVDSIGIAHDANVADQIAGALAGIRDLLQTAQTLITGNGDALATLFAEGARITQAVAPTSGYIAPSLLALGTTIRTTVRELPLAELYRLPTTDDPRTTTLADDELILELDVPIPEASVYLKAMDRQLWAFPIVGVAAARTAGEVRLGLAGVAPVPWTLTSVDELDTATPLPGTAYKLPIARALVGRALRAVATG